MNQKKWKNRNFVQALKYSICGIGHTLNAERNFKIQIVFAILAVAAGIFFKLTYIEFAVLALTIGFVLFAEMVNTAIEEMLDLYSQEYNEGIKIAKDIASGAVLVAAIVSVVVGCILFLPKM